MLWPPGCISFHSFCGEMRIRPVGSQNLLHLYSIITPWPTKKTGGLLSTRPMASILPRCCLEILLLPNRDKVAGIHGENDVEKALRCPAINFFGTPTCMAKDLQLKLGGYGVGWPSFFQPGLNLSIIPLQKADFFNQRSLDDIPCWNFWIYALVPEHGNGESPLHNRTQ